MRRALKTWTVVTIVTALIAAAELLFSVGAESQERDAAGNPTAAEIQTWPPAAADFQLHLIAVLGLRNTDQLENLKAQLQQPDSPSYHRWLSSADFARQFGPTDAQLQTATGWLKSSGFTIDSADLGMREIRFSGSVAQVQQALNIAIVSNGSQFTNLNDPQIPASLAGSIVAFFGLKNLNPDPAPASDAAPQPISLSAIVPDNKHFSPQDLWAFYNEAPPTDAGANGGTAAPDCIALLEVATLPAVPSPSASPTPSVLDIFTSQFNIPTTQIQIIPTDPNTAPSQPKDNEPPLDVDWAHSVAPNTPIRLYVSTIPHSTTAAFDTLSLAVSQNVCGVISSSIDDKSPCPDLAQIQAYAQVDAQAVMQGQTLFHSSGDYGSFYPCGQPASTPGQTTMQPSIEESSASSDVTVVGGTQFNPVYDANGLTSVLAPGFEQVWQSFSALPEPPPSAPEKGTSGGGISVVFAAPPWQTAILPYGLTAPLTMRGVPDVSIAASSSEPGYWIATTKDRAKCHGASTCFIGDGGTSASSPIWAGISRLIAQSLNTTRLGNINPRLYRLAAGENPALVDVSQLGNNCTFDTCSTFPGYQVGPGYDLGTGLGSPDIKKLIAAFQPSATASASNISSSGQTGQTVPAGVLSVTNTSISRVTINSVTVAVSNPDLFSSLTMSGSVDGAAAQTAVAGALGSSTVFTLNPPLSLPAGAVAQFTLNATISPNAARTDTGLRYAALPRGAGLRGIGSRGVPGAGTLEGLLSLPGLLGLLGIGLVAIPTGRRRRARGLTALIMLATLLASSQIGCGGDGNRGSGGNSGAPVMNSSQQQVPAGGVDATSADEAVGVQGLPATMSTIRLSS